MRSSLNIIDAETLMATPLKPTLYLVEGLIPEGVSIFSGPSKIGKSWLMLWLSIQIALGQPVWGIPTTACDVLYFCLEDTKTRLKKRLYEICSDPPSNLRFTTASSKIGEGLEEELRETLTRYPLTKLVIIDTLQKVRGGRKGVNRAGMYGDDYDDISAMKAIADQFHLAMILVHHVRKLKDQEDPFNQVSGSTGILGAADTLYVLSRDTQNGDTATLLIRGRDVEQQKLRLRFQDCVWTLLERMDQTQLRQSSVPQILHNIVEFMETRTQWSGTTTELLDALGDEETPPNSVTKHISQFYYPFLVPQGITYQTRRTSRQRLITLRRRDGSDSNDGNSPH